MPTISLDFLIIIPVCIIFIILLLYGVYVRSLDRNLLLGIFSSAILYEIISVNFYVGFTFSFNPISFLLYFLFGFIGGTTAGLLNENIKRGVLSGVIGMVLAMTLRYPIIFIPIIFFVSQSLPTILGGAIGGAVGSQGIKSYYFKKKATIKPQLD